MYRIHELICSPRVAQFFSLILIDRYNETLTVVTGIQIHLVRDIRLPWKCHVCNLVARMSFLQKRE